MQNRNREIVKYPKVLMKKTQKFHEERKSIFIYEVHMEHDASIYSRVHFEQVRQNNVADISFCLSELQFVIFMAAFCPAFHF